MFFFFFSKLLVCIEFGSIYRWAWAIDVISLYYIRKSFLYLSVFEYCFGYDCSLTHMFADHHLSYINHEMSISISTIKSVFNFFKIKEKISTTNCIFLPFNESIFFFVFCSCKCCFALLTLFLVMNCEASSRF